MAWSTWAELWVSQVDCCHPFFRKILYYFKRLFNKINSTHIYLFAGKCAGHPFLNVLDLTPWGISPWVSHVLPWKGYNFGGRKSTVERIFSDQGPTIILL